ncbi:MAG: hypothetical protein NVSMB31_18510 [Vulcanimicrobiaceae bacterium]
MALALRFVPRMTERSRALTATCALEPVDDFVNVNTIAPMPKVSAPMRSVVSASPVTIGLLPAVGLRAFPDPMR